MILAVSLLGASGVDALAEDSMNSAGQDAVIDILRELLDKACQIVLNSLSRKKQREILDAE